MVVIQLLILFLLVVLLHKSDQERASALNLKMVI